MTTTAAAFTSFELSLAHYLCHGGTEANLAGRGFAGMTVAPLFQYCRIGLTKTDPRTIVYPTVFAQTFFRNATFEPTVAEWDAYARKQVNRLDADWEVTNTAGLITFRNINAITFPAVGATTASGGSPLTLPYAIFTLPKAVISGGADIGLLVAELDTPISITGVGAGPSIPALNLEFEIR